MRYLIFLLPILVGCPSRYSPDDIESTIRYSNDPVWTSYRFDGPMPRAYKHSFLFGWESTGPDVTQADIASAPCRVVLGKYRTSHYDVRDNVIYLDVRVKLPILWHESQHCIDMHSGIFDRKELERRAMIAEMSGVFRDNIGYVH